MGDGGDKGDGAEGGTGGEGGGGDDGDGAGGGEGGGAPSKLRVAKVGWQPAGFFTVTKRRVADGGG